MKCKAFASQLEAHVGQSPVRGGEAIKTDRKALNNLISCVKKHLRPQGYTRYQRCNKRRTAHRHIGRKRSQTESCTRRQLWHTDRKTALQRLHQRCQSYFRRCDLCRVARNPYCGGRCRSSTRQRATARWSHLDKRCKMARPRTEKVHQFPHAALPQAPHPAPRLRLRQDRE